MLRLFCPVEDLHKKTGWYVAHDVLDPESGRVLLRCNYRVTAELSDSLKRRGIDTLYVSDQPVDEDADDGVKSIVEVKRTRTALENVFADVSETLLNRFKVKGGRFVELTPELLGQVRDVVEDVIDTLLANPTAALYMGVMDSTGSYLLKHSANVCLLSLCLALRSERVQEIIACKRRGLARFNTPGYRLDPRNLVPLGTTALLHDIGKVLLLELINTDRRYAANDAVWEKIKAHPKVGHDILFGKSVDAHVLLGIKYHHENVAGDGYPYGVRGDSIHVYSRIIRVVDSYDAATAVRPGREFPKSHNEVLDELVELAGRHYDKELVLPFVELMGGDEKT